MPLHPLMERALILGRQGLDSDEVPVGAVVADRWGRPISEAFNSGVSMSNPLAHAEMLAIARAVGDSGRRRLDDCDIYITLEPCAMCAAAISLVRIRRVVFAAEDSKMGAIYHGPCWFRQPTCHHSPEVISGIGAEVAAGMMREFFALRR